MPVKALELGIDVVLITVAEQGPPGPGGGGGGGSGHTIQEDGTNLPSRANLNFGDGILAEDNAISSRTDISVTTALIGAVDLDNVGVPGGVASLDGSGKVPTAQLPSFTVTDVFVVASEAEMLALSATVGDYAIRTDTNQTFILASDPPSVLGNWVEILTGGGVTSVNGETGAVILDAADVGAVDSDDVGVSGGVASLDGSGKVPDGQIPNSITRDSELDLAVSSSMNTHLAAGDPHPQYLTGLEGDLAYWPLSTDLATQVELDQHIANGPHDATDIVLNTATFDGLLNTSTTNVQFLAEIVDELGTPPPNITDGTYLLGTLHGGLPNAIVVGTTPGGELGGTWAAPTIDAVHSGSSHADIQTAAEATAASLLANHEAETIAVHGIADTSLLETQAGAQAKIDAHIAATTDQHVATAVTVDAALYSSVLGPAVTNAQLLADAVNALVGASIPIDADSFSGNLTSSVVNVQLLADAVDQLNALTSTVDSVNGQTGIVVLDAGDVGAVDATEKGQPNGVATLDGTGKLTLAEWPPLVTTVNGVTGEVILQGTDIPLNVTFFNKNLDSSITDLQLLADAVDNLAIPTGAGLPNGLATLDGSGILELAQRPPAVTDINGFTGEVTLTGADIPIAADLFSGNLDNTVTDVQLLAEAVDALTTGGGGGGGAPADATYLTTTSNGTLSNEVVVGTTPGGELGGTWASPTVDATHSGSSHASVQAAAEATAAAALSAHVGAADPHTGYVLESLFDAAGDLLIGSADNTPAKLAAPSTNGYVLRRASGTVGWGNDVAGPFTSGAYVAPPLSDFAFDEGTATPTALNVPAIAISSNVTVTAEPTSIDQGTPLLIHFNQDLKYPGTGVNGPQYAVPYRPTAWDFAGFDDSHYPRAVISAEGISTFYKPAGLLATEPTFIDLRATQNAPKRSAHTVTGGATTSGLPTITGTSFSPIDVGLGITGTNIPGSTTIIAVADSTHATISNNATGTGSGITFNIAADPANNITNAHSFINNHTFLVDTDDINWAVPVQFGGGADEIVVMFNCYPSGGFVDGPAFTPHHTNHGTLTNASHVSFYSGPTVVAGVHMNQRWGYYYEDTMDDTIGIPVPPSFPDGLNWMNAVTANGKGDIDRQVAIQIGTLRSADDYNIAINYGDPNVAHAPLFRVGADGVTTTPAVNGLNNLLVLNANESAAGIGIFNARTLNVGPIDAYTHNIAGGYLGLSVGPIAGAHPITMDAASTANNSYGGIALSGTITFNHDGPAVGSTMFSAVNTFKNSGSGTRAMGGVFGLFVSPAFQADTNPATVTSIGILATPTFSTANGASSLTASITTMQSTPVVNDVNVHITGRTVIEIADISGSAGTIDSNIGINIAAFSRGTVKHGIVNASDTILSGGLWGSTASGGDLDVHATSNATTGTINLHDEVEQRPTDQTFTATPKWIYWDNNYTLNFTNAAFGGFLGATPTITFAQSGTGFGAGVYTNMSPTVVPSANSLSLGLHIGYAFGTTYSASTFTSTTATSITGFSAAPTFTIGSGGGLTVTAATNYSSVATVNTGAAVTTFTHFLITDAAGTASTPFTTNIGIDIPAMTKGTTNIGIRNASSSILSGGVYGSDALGGNLTLNATTNATKGVINVADGMEFRPTDQTFTATPIWFVWDNTYTMNMATAAIGSFINVSPTVLYQQSGSGFGATIGMTISPTVKTLTTGTANLGLTLGLAVGPTITADTITGRTASVVGVQVSPSYTRANSGTFASSGNTVTDFTSGFTMNISGSTIDSLTHYGVSNATVTAGTLTLQVGLDIPALSGATTNYGIRSLGNNILTTIYGDTASGGDLNLRSTTHATTGSIFMHDEVEMQPNDATYTATPNWLFWNNTYTMNFSNGNYGSFISVAPTVSYSQAGFGFGAGAIVSLSPTIKTSTSGANLGLHYGIFNAPTLNATTQTGITGSLTTYYAGPSETGTTSGTLALATVTNFSSNFTLNGAASTTSTLTTLNHFSVANASITNGTITSQYGLDIAALSGATTNVGIRTAAPIVFTPTTKTISAASDTLAVTSPFININNVSGGGITLTSNPTIPDTGASEGQLLIVVNTDSADTVTFTEGNNMKLDGATNMALGPGDIVTFIYIGGLWRQMTPRMALAL